MLHINLLQICINEVSDLAHIHFAEHMNFNAIMSLRTNDLLGLVAMLSRNKLHFVTAAKCCLEKLCLKDSYQKRVGTNFRGKDLVHRNDMSLKVDYQLAATQFMISQV